MSNHAYDERQWIVLRCRKIRIIDSTNEFKHVHFAVRLTIWNYTDKMRSR